LVSKEEVLGVLKTVVDPEIAFNIVDLGLVYDIQVKGNSVSIKMTLTTPACPFGPELIEEVKRKVGVLQGVGTVDVEIVWEPPWAPDKMSDYAKMELGIG